MKVYIAGKWTAKEQVASRIDNVKSIGHTITHDWTLVEHGDSRPEMSHYSQLDVKGVVEADLFIGLFEDPQYAYRGSFTELGVALGYRQMGFQKEIWVVCPDELSYAQSNIFIHHPFIRHFNSWEACYMALTAI